MELQKAKMKNSVVYIKLKKSNRVNEGKRQRRGSLLGCLPVVLI